MRNVFSNVFRKKDFSSYKKIEIRYNIHVCKIDFVSSIIEEKKENIPVSCVASIMSFGEKSVFERLPKEICSVLKVGFHL